MQSLPLILLGLIKLRLYDSTLSQHALPTAPGITGSHLLPYIIAPVLCSLQPASLTRTRTFNSLAPLHCHTRTHRPRPRARAHSHSRSTSPRTRTRHTRPCARHHIAHTHISAHACGIHAHAHDLTLHTHTSPTALAATSTVPALVAISVLVTGKSHYRWPAF